MTIFPRKDGTVQCPHCQRWYVPALQRKDDGLVKEQYSNEPLWKRDQLVSGLCSEYCWTEFQGYL